ncbi:MAG: T9SS type A sorting domain-containing protein [Saprospiraceae bacterium]|nr:T9SS type A sorting domain-containing protein [Saprospiraceae bacterium]
MVRRIIFLTPIYIWTFIFSQTIWSQSDFNLEFHRDFGCTRVEMLFEDKDHYYSIGYSQAFGKPEVEVMVNAHEKKSGKINQTAYYGVDSTWLSVDGRSGIIVKGDKLLFGFVGVGKGTLYLLQYDTNERTISIKDTIVQDSGMYIFDLVSDNEGNLVCSYTVGGNNQRGVITVFKPDGTKTHHPLDNSGLIRFGGKMYPSENGNWYFVTQWFPALNDHSLVVAELDSAFNVLWTWKSPWADRIYSAKYILPIEDNQLLIMANGDDHDSIKNTIAYVQWIYRFNLKSRQMLWRGNYGYPASRIITHGGQIVRSHQDSAYLMCTSAVLAGSTLDNYVLAGRAAKFRDNGDAIWIRDYVYESEDGSRNRFVSMLPTQDGNYLLGGFILSTKCLSWLVKIDEDGRILPLDTTSSSEEYVEIDQTKKIKIYPNPVSDILYISQNETANVQYTLMDMQGLTIKSIFVSGADTEIMWDVSQVPQGMYVLSMEQEGRLLGSKKIVKK